MCAGQNIRDVREWPVGFAHRSEAKAGRYDSDVFDFLVLLC